MLLLEEATPWLYTGDWQRKSDTYRRNWYGFNVRLAMKIRYVCWNWHMDYVWDPFPGTLLRTTMRQPLSSPRRTTLALRQSYDMPTNLSWQSLHGNLYMPITSGNHGNLPRRAQEGSSHPLVGPGSEAARRMAAHHCYAPCCRGHNLTLKMHIHIGCICLTFLHCVFWNATHHCHAPRCWGHNNTWSWTDRRKVKWLAREDA